MTHHEDSQAIMQERRHCGGTGAGATHTMGVAAFANGMTEVVPIRMTADRTTRQAVSDNMLRELHKAEHAIRATTPTLAAARGHERQATTPTYIPRKPQERVAVISKRVVVESAPGDDDLLVEGSGYSSNKGRLSQRQLEPTPFMKGPKRWNSLVT